MLRQKVNKKLTINKLFTKTLLPLLHVSGQFRSELHLQEVVQCPEERNKAGEFAN